MGCFSLILTGQYNKQDLIIMIRINLRITVMLVLVVALVFIVSLWTRCGELIIPVKNGNAPRRNSKFLQNQGVYINDGFERGSSDLQSCEEIDCIVNNEFTISCRREGDQVYLPFSFINKYFEVYGKVVSYDGYDRFEWSHSYSKVYYPKEKYNPKGVFMYFENYNVEVRDRVKCVSAIEGVPVSTQWESLGYFYPTQIAQFGLAHYSKNLTDPEPRRIVIEDGDKETAKWVPTSDSFITRIIDPYTNSYVLQFFSPDSFSSGISLKLDRMFEFVLGLNIKMSGNSSFTVTLHGREKKEIFFLHYICSDLHISAQDQHIYHGIGYSSNWRKLTRDLLIDLQKGLAYLNKPKRKITKSKFQVAGIMFRGSGSLDNLTLSSSDHISQFYDAAQWFVRNQDPATGGWPNPVRRRVAPGIADLEPGWYSAMGQGHAISLLSRAYYHSGGEPQYLRAAIAGLRPFHIPSSEGGVLAMFLDKYPWYEEYPTFPSSFVLNGFIYSLLGLYDLKTIAPHSMGVDATTLYERGMTSLKKLLPLYDTGSGTTYDLRHFSLGTAPNIARWDYHSTHVNQLLMLNTIEQDQLLVSTAERWIGYMSGKRAPHN